jgi:hypothetical protein
LIRLFVGCDAGYEKWPAAARHAMTIHSVDLAVLVVYVAATILVGLWVSKRGSKDLDSYFLGGKKLPWYKPKPRPHDGRCLVVSSVEVECTSRSACA